MENVEKQADGLKSDLRRLVLTNANGTTHTLGHKNLGEDYAV